MKILFNETDENNALTVNDLIARLAKANIDVERKTIYSDILALRDFGLDIKMERSKTYNYFMASRTFELPELKLLVDAVQSSKFITIKKSNELIKKLQSLASRYEAVQLQRQVYVSNRVKTMNESIYYNVDVIHQAIISGKKIGFKYFEYTVDKQKKYRKDGQFYEVSPVSLTWDDENYYLITYSLKYQDLTHYRVDKMTDIFLSNEPRDIYNKDEFDVALYAQKVFGMFNGEEQQVKIQFDNSLVGVVVDRFGKNVNIIKSDEAHFTVSLKITISPVFVGWLFQFGAMVKVLSPDSLIEELRQQAYSIFKLYS
ncbi:WYL domain-containing protein [Dehalobacter sp. MCB1]|uniref:helix-turn-helix transcriptional regulator n=1 Tax=unclassified Dehalobacter TaxID=2635733 RepID=UPI0032B83803